MKKKRETKRDKEREREIEEHGYDDEELKELRHALTLKYYNKKTIFI